MSADKLKYAIGNSSSTTLSGSVANDDTTMTITSDTNFNAKNGEGMVVIDEGTANEEFAYSTGKTGTTLTTPVANRGLEGGSASAHDANATVKGIITATMWNDVIDSLANVVSKTTGSVDTTKVVDLSTAQTLTNKTIGTSNLISFNAPDGFLINGKIAVSVDGSGNMTVAIKGKDGNDPSATNPIYIRIGDTVHSITSALSVTKNAGTNWFNAGSNELATKEIDYFVYLGYNATDGLVLGFSRIPYASEYDDFSATSTDEKYCAISTITNAVAGDDYVNIGRFAATLSAGAGYTWSVPTFTNKNLIQRPIFNTRWLSWTPTIGYQFGSVNPTSNTVNKSYYCVNENGTVSVDFKATLVVGSMDYALVMYTTPFNYKSDVMPFRTFSSVYEVLYFNTAYLENYNKISFYKSGGFTQNGSFGVAGEYQI